MPVGSASVPTEVSEQVSPDALPESSGLGEKSEHCPLPRENGVTGDNQLEGGQGIENAHEDEDEDEDTDFNPFLKTNSPEASSSLSSEVENLDIDGADCTGRRAEVVAGISEGRQMVDMQDLCASVQIDNCEVVTQSTASSLEDCGRKLDGAYAAIRKEELALINQSRNGSFCDEGMELVHLSDSTNVLACKKSMVDVDSDDAICMRTRARYSLASFTLDELETFLQETDDEDDLQKVADDEEYRKFLAAISRGDGIQNLHGNGNGDDDDEENDADFELELEEALESEPEGIEQRRTTRLIKRQKTAFDRSKKVSGQACRPLRPLLPFSSMGPYSGFEGKQISPNISQSFVSPLNNSFCGFTQHQIGQLHCLIYEHVQLLIQVFSICVFEPVKSNIATEVKDLLLEILHQRDQVLTWKAVPYPSFYFSPPCIIASVMDEGQGMLQPNCSKDNVMQSFPSGSHMHLPSNTISIYSGRDMHLLDVQAGSTRTSECTSWAPCISGPVLSVLDVAPLRLVESYVNDVSSAVQAYERCQIELGFENQCPKEHLFPLHCTPCPAQSYSQGEIESNSPDCSGLLSSSSHDQMPKKTMAAVLLEKAKDQPVSLVPKDIAKLAQRFCSLFNPALYPHKPPPAALANRVLFTDAEDRLLALGLMEYNTDWKAIQQRFLPCKSRHQIFVRQKNRASSKAPENPIKAVRRIKNSPLTPEEIVRIEMGLKRFKLDWVSIWRFFVPYRDPSLLPRQWRIASGTQKSYKSDANRKAKRRLCELRRKASKPSHSTLHSPSDKEGDSTDNAVGETNCWNKHIDKDDEAYVHEAFLADWRSDNNGCAVVPTFLPPQEGSHPRAWIDNSVSIDIQSQNFSRFPAASGSSTQVYLRPYRARTTNGARLVKLAPDLPPVNLPPSVRVISQSTFKSSQPAASAQVGNISRISSRAVENHTLYAGTAALPGVHYSQKNSAKVAPSSQNANDPKVIFDKHTPESSVADLQMHPLLFQPTQDGHLPYYSPNCRSGMPSSFTFVSGKQPQLGFGLFHNARHIKDAGSSLSKPSRSPEKIAQSSGIVFHPLLQRTDDADTETGAARPPCSESKQKCALVHKFSASVSNKIHDNHNNSSASGTKAAVTHCNISELDLNQETAEGRDLTQVKTGKSLCAHTSGVAELKLANDLGKKTSSVPNEISSEIDSGDFELFAARYDGDKVSEDMHNASLPEIIMEQEELSDSEEELEEHVEFECEEMTDSEGDSTSDSEQFDNIPNELYYSQERLADEVDEHKDNQLTLNAQNSSGRRLRSTSAIYSKRPESAAKLMNINSNIRSLSLNSCQAVSLHSNPNNSVASFGYFGTSGAFVQDQLPAGSKRSSRPLKPGAQYLHKDAMEAPVSLVSPDASPKHSRKRVCKSTSSSRIAYSGKGNLSQT